VGVFFGLSVLPVFEGQVFSLVFCCCVLVVCMMVGLVSLMIFESGLWVCEGLLNIAND
jgi:hypothetical protein